MLKIVGLSLILRAYHVALYTMFVMKYFDVLSFSHLPTIRGCFIQSSHFLWSSAASLGDGGQVSKLLQTISNQSQLRTRTFISDMAEVVRYLSFSYMRYLIYFLHFLKGLP